MYKSCRLSTSQIVAVTIWHFSLDASYQTSHVIVLLTFQGPVGIGNLLRGLGPENSHGSGYENQRGAGYQQAAYPQIGQHRRPHSKIYF